MVPANQIIHLSKQAFWDVDMSKLDHKNQANYIIRKVFDYGTWEDMAETVNYYGEGAVKHALTTAPYLKQLTVIFASKLFHIPINHFKCSSTKQYHPV